MLSPEEINTEIRASLEFLQARVRDLPDRQSSIRAVFSSSWQRLSADEQSALMRLAVFRSGFTRAEAQVVATAMLPILGNLVSASLLQRDSAQGGRYQIHELRRQYAEKHLKTARAWAKRRPRTPPTSPTFHMHWNRI